MKFCPLVIIFIVRSKQQFIFLLNLRVQASKRCSELILYVYDSNFKYYC